MVDSLEQHGVAILPPLDVSSSSRLLHLARITAVATMLDPWYNKGVGGVRDDYQEYVLSLIEDTIPVSKHAFLWGFPEIVAGFVGKLPEPLTLVAWLTWYYKNSPSVIRGWRSSQMACLHMAWPEAKLFPEHFLNEAQKKLRDNGKLRYMPGPTSVIEDSLLVGFVGKKEQTGHPAQKPVGVFSKLLLMSTREGDVVFDPMSGSGTTGVAAREHKRVAILSDHSEEYTQIAESRLGVERVAFSKDLISLLDDESPESVQPLTEEFADLSFTSVHDSQYDTKKRNEVQNPLFTNQESELRSATVESQL